VGRRPDFLLSLAEETGGRPFVGTNRPELLLPQMVRDASAYYLLGYRSPAPTDGKFHKIKVRMNKDGYEVRARSGYFAPSVGDMERGRAAAAAAELPPDIERALGELSASARTDREFDSWIGMARADDGRTRVTIAWAPRATSKPGGLALTIEAVSPDGTSYFSASRTTTQNMTFDAPAGELVLSTKAFNARGDEIDSDRRKMTVPRFDDAGLAIGSPFILRTRTARDARAMQDGNDALPEVGREFDRSDRLFVRFSVYGGPQVAVTARLLNRQGKELQALRVAALKESLYQLDVPLSGSGRDDYLISIEATRGAESVKTLVPFHVR